LNLLFLAMILQITMQIQASMLLNKDFLPTLVACGGTTACAKDYLPGWAAIYHKADPRTYSAFRIQTDNAVTGGSGLNYWFDLKYFNNRACANQQLTYMPAGDYTLTFDYYMDAT
jgi:hypothetical protein